MRRVGGGDGVLARESSNIRRRRNEVMSETRSFLEGLDPSAASSKHDALAFPFRIT